MIVRKGCVSVFIIDANILNPNTQPASGPIRYISQSINIAHPTQPTNPLQIVNTVSMMVAKSSNLRVDGDDVLANTSTALSIANNIASLIPVPVVSNLIQAAQNVATVAQVNRYGLGWCLAWISNTLLPSGYQE